MVEEQHWEYKVIVLDLIQYADQDDLNSEGEDGWELVTVTSKGLAYLKRLVDRRT